MKLELEIAEDVLQRLSHEAAAAGRTIEEHVAAVVSQYVRPEASRVTKPVQVDDGEPQLPPDYKPIWEQVAEIFADVPEEELEKLPRDGAEQHDHYLYGAPKK